VTEPVLFGEERTKHKVRRIGEPGLNGYISSCNYNHQKFENRKSTVVSWLEQPIRYIQQLFIKRKSKCHTAAIHGRLGASARVVIIPTFSITPNSQCPRITYF
jgi:hypothetical protein